MRIFISYRRSDEAIVVGQVAQRLRAAYGDDAVFHDVDTIDVGSDFRADIGAWIRDRADAVLLMIGRAWQPERLHQESDYVRFEIEQALATQVLVVPVLIGHEVHPTASGLPESVAPVVTRNSQQLRSPPDFARDLEDLITRLDRAVPHPTARRFQQAMLPPSPPRCLGRDTELEEVIESLLDAGSGPCIVLGPPGIGKTTVLTAALHADRVALRFGERRILVTADGLTEATGLWARIAGAVGVPLGQHLAQRVRAALAALPTVLIIDTWRP